jgi:hypothetical protein
VYDHKQPAAGAEIPAVVTLAVLIQDDGASLGINRLRESFQALATSPIHTAGDVGFRAWGDIGVIAGTPSQRIISSAWDV